MQVIANIDIVINKIHYSINSFSTSGEVRESFYSTLSFMSEILGKWIKKQGHSSEQTGTWLFSLGPFDIGNAIRLRVGKGVTHKITFLPKCVQPTVYETHWKYFYCSDNAQHRGVFTDVNTSLELCFQWGALSNANHAPNNHLMACHSRSAGQLSGICMALNGVYDKCAVS